MKALPRRPRVGEPGHWNEAFAEIRLGTVGALAPMLHPAGRLFCAASCRRTSVSA
jgi:hypothetical protein